MHQAWVARYPPKAGRAWAELASGATSLPVLLSMMLFLAAAVSGAALLSGSPHVPAHRAPTRTILMLEDGGVESVTSPDPAAAPGGEVDIAELEFEERLAVLASQVRPRLASPSPSSNPAPSSVTTSTQIPKVAPASVEDEFFCGQKVGFRVPTCERHSIRAVPPWPRHASLPFATAQVQDRGLLGQG